MTSDNPRAKEWQNLVAFQAQSVAEGGLFRGPVSVAVVFKLKRPLALKDKVGHHLTAPDIDKLARCALDGLVGVLLRDDSVIVELRARKLYARFLEAPGAEITVAEAAPPQPEQSSFDLFAEED